MIVFTSNRHIYRDSFVGLREHRNEHVDEHDDHASAVAAEHQFADELGHVMTLVDSEDFHGCQAVDGEVQRLHRLEQADAQDVHTALLDPF